MCIEVPLGRPVWVGRRRDDAGSERYLYRCSDGEKGEHVMGRIQTPIVAVDEGDISRKETIYCDFERKGGEATRTDFLVRWLSAACEPRRTNVRRAECVAETGVTARGRTF